MSLDIIREQDLKKINNILRELREESDAICTLLIDKGGHVIAHQGFSEKFDIVALSALAAGSFASTKEIAKMVGEPEFTMMFHQGKKEHIHISLVNDMALLLVIFDDRTTVGMVRVYANQYSKELGAILEEAQKTAKGAAKDLNKISGEDIEGALDSVLPDEE